MSIVRNEVVTVTLLGSPVYAESVQLTKGVGKGYNTATISGKKLTPLVGDTLVITVNGHETSVLVDAKDYGKRDKITLRCKGLSCVLDDELPSDDPTDYADSDELIADSAGSIPTNVQIPTIPLDAQSYTKSANAMGRISDMVSVVGGELWELDDVLQVTPMRTIASGETPFYSFADDEVIDFSYSDKRASDLKVKNIHFNPTHDTIVGKPDVVILYGALTLGSTAKSGQVLFTPSLSTGNPYSTSGINGLLRYLQKTEQFILSSETVFYVEAGIDLVSLITVDGTPLTGADYTFYPTWNAIKLNTPTSGNVSITYSTKGLYFTVSRTTQVVASYECMVASGTIEINSSSSSRNPTPDGKEKPDDKANEVTRSTFVNIKSLTYEKGGVVEVSKNTPVTLLFAESQGSPNSKFIKTLSTGGSSISVKYIYDSSVWSDESFMTGVSATVVESKAVKTGTVSTDPDLGYIVYLDGEIKAVTAVYFGHTPITGYTYHSNGGNSYVSFNSADKGKNVSIAVTVDIVRITIPAISSTAPTAHSLDAYTPTNLVTKDIDLETSTMKTLPSTFDINVVSLLGVSLDDAQGKTLTGDFGNLTVSDVGTVTITVANQGKFTINTGSVKLGTLIKVNSEGADYA